MTPPFNVLRNFWVDAGVVVLEKHLATQTKNASKMISRTEILPSSRKKEDARNAKVSHGSGPDI